MKKELGILLLTVLLISGCGAEIKSTENKASEAYHLSSSEIAALDKEYSFENKALTANYIKRKLKTFVGNDNGVANASKIVKELEYAKAKGEGFVPFKEMVTDDNSLYTLLTAVPAVIARRAESASFNQFISEADPFAPIVNKIYVNGSLTTGLNNGTSWANAYRGSSSLLTALSKATTGSQIWLAAGTYKPAASPWTFQMKAGVEIYGGFVGNETSLSQRNFNTNVVILSGDLNNSNTANSGDATHVVRGANNAVLDGVSIKHGYGRNGTATEVIIGGGMYNTSNQSPTLRNIIFSDNYARIGGGMYNAGPATKLINVSFIDNIASEGGGAIFNASNMSLENVIFTNNKSTSTGGSTAGGGAMYNSGGTPTLINVTITGNQGRYGGGIYNSNSSPKLTNVTFTNNSALGLSPHGGGMYNSKSSPELTDVTFTGNSAEDYGGGMYNYDTSSPKLTNVTFSNNSAEWGGGIYNQLSSSPILTDVTFSNNTATYGGGGMANASSSTPTLTDVTFLNNSANKSGGGLCNVGGSPSLNKVYFIGNTAKEDGGGMYQRGYSTSNLSNVSFIGNSTLSSGGGIYIDGYAAISSSNITNTTFYNNTASSGGAMVSTSTSTTVKNTIFWGNINTYSGGNKDIFLNSGILTIGYSIIEGGYSNINVNHTTIKNLSGTTLTPSNFLTAGNILTIDPKFISSENLALQSGSPARNAGTNDGAPATDIIGTARPQGSITDIGAYEFVE